MTFLLLLFLVVIAAELDAIRQAVAPEKPRAEWTNGKWNGVKE
jgi:hypothetical protein